MSEEIPDLSETLDCLVMWPDDTHGFQREQVLVRTLNRLSQQHGYGRVAQVMQQLEELWRNPDSLEAFEVVRQDYLELIAKGESNVT